MEGFEELQRMYREVLPEKRDALQREWNAILAGAPPQAHADALRRQLHQLSGSAGAYGFDAMGEMARELEKAWVQWLAAGAATRTEAHAVCERHAASMQTLLEALRVAALPPQD
jgi:HPt (histidine-containing phosphotransfer) domain-containing protein